MQSPLEADLQMGKAFGYEDEMAVNQTEFLDPQGKYKLIQKGSHAAVEVAITLNDGVKTEGGALIRLSDNVELEAKLEGSVAGGMFRSCCAGEGMFFSHLNLSQGTQGSVLLAPGVPGDVVLIALDGTRKWMLQRQAYFACDNTVCIGVKTKKFVQGCCSGAGFFRLVASGVGRLLINSYGGMLRFDLKPGEKRKIDNGYLVAWSDDLQQKTKKAASGVAGSVLSGEGLVVGFTGPGTIYVQTRSIKALAKRLQ